jgi:hypothetical protein
MVPRRQPRGICARCGDLDTARLQLWSGARVCRTCLRRLGSDELLRRLERDPTLEFRQLGWCTIAGITLFIVLAMAGFFVAGQSGGGLPLWGSGGLCILALWIALVAVQHHGLTRVVFGHGGITFYRPLLGRSRTYPAAAITDWRPSPTGRSVLVTLAGVRPWKVHRLRLGGPGAQALLLTLAAADQRPRPLGWRLQYAVRA